MIISILQVLELKNYGRCLEQEPDVEPDIELIYY